MHRTFFPFLLFAAGSALLVACGLQTSQAGGVGQIQPYPGPDAGTDSGPPCQGEAPPDICGTTCGSVVGCVNGKWTCEDTSPCPPPPPDGGTVCDNFPQPYCTGCKGESISPSCVDGSWQCPWLGCPIDIDAGDAGCGAPPPDACSIAPPCNGEYYTPVCVGTSWICELEGACTAQDAGQPFACGSVGCDPATSYCQITTGGPVNPDGGAQTGFACDLLPSACTAGQATCACLGIVGQGCSCVEQHGDVTLTCELP